MRADKINTEEIFQLIDDTTSEFLKTVLSFDESEINEKPGEDRWSAGQVAEHVTRSNKNIIKELSKQGRVCEREPDTGVEQIRSIFLNFEKKLNSPEFILPTSETYSREMLIGDLKSSIDQLKETAKEEDMFQLIHHAIFGEVTRLETLYFVVYHTQRHIHQLKNIKKVIQASN